MIYTMYLPVFWGMNPGEPSFTRFQARKKSLFLALVFEPLVPVTRWSVQWTWPIIRRLGEICFSQKSPCWDADIKRGTIFDRQAGRSKSQWWYLLWKSWVSTDFLYTTKDLLKTKQAKDSGRRSGAVIEYHVHEGKFNTKLASMLQHKTRRRFTGIIYTVLSRNSFITFITWNIPKKTSTVKVLMTLTVTHNQ